MAPTGVPSMDIPWLDADEVRTSESRDIFVKRLGLARCHPRPCSRVGVEHFESMYGSLLTLMSI